ncbi:MAG: hypothetical protein ACE5IR_20190 [bacterium]
MQKRIIFFILVCTSFIAAHQLHAGAWTLKKRQLWVKSTFLVQQTSDRYASINIVCGDATCRNGQKTPYFFNGKIETSAIIFDLWYGLTDHIELRFQLPYYDIAFKDEVNPERPSTNDIGDIRFAARYRLPFDPIVTTLRIGAKAPTGFFNKDSEVVPIGDGQWDLEIGAEFGRSFWPIPAYANLMLQYRFRFEPDLETTNLDPGDELEFRAEAGVTVYKNIGVKALLEGFWGQEFTALSENSNFQLSNSERRILYFRPGIWGTFFKSLEYEFSVRFSLSGKNFPAGQIFMTGLSYTFDL